MEYILIFITAIFVNNIVLSQFLGICPFLGVSKKVETATGMGAAVAFVLTVATIVTYLIQKFIADEEYHISLLKKALKEYEDSDDEPKKCKSVTVII